MENCIRADVFVKSNLIQLSTGCYLKNVSVKKNFRETFKFSYERAEEIIPSKKTSILPLSSFFPSFILLKFETKNALRTSKAAKKKEASQSQQQCSDEAMRAQNDEHGLKTIVEVPINHCARISTKCSPTESNGSLRSVSVCILSTRFSSLSDIHLWRNTILFTSLGFCFQDRAQRSRFPETSLSFRAAREL